MSFLDVTKILKDKGYNGVSDNDVVTSLKEVGYIPPNTPDIQGQTIMQQLLAVSSAFCQRLDTFMQKSYGFQS